MMGKLPKEKRAVDGKIAKKIVEVIASIAQYAMYLLNKLSKIGKDILIVLYMHNATD